MCMTLNSNEIFYRKILSGITLFCCVFLIIVLNLIRYEHLTRSAPLPQKPNLPQPEYLFSVSFSPLENKNNPRMILLSNTPSKEYFSSVFSSLKNTSFQTVFVINCTKNNPSTLKNFFTQSTIIESPCNIEPENLRTILSSEDSVVVLLLNKTFIHPTALRVAERFHLKPNLKITEIYHANKRL